MYGDSMATKKIKEVVKKNDRINYEDIKDFTKDEQKEIVKENTKKAKHEAFKELMPYIIIIVFVVIIRTFIITPVSVNGTSMQPNLESGDILLVYKLRYRLQGPKRFDVVTIDKKGGDLVKRVIGLPGDKIRYVVKKDDEGKLVSELYINDEIVEEKFISDDAKADTCSYDNDICTKTVTVPADHYYVIGDNRRVSMDSRIIGLVSKDEIFGISEVRIFPFNRFGNFNKNK